MLSHPVGLVDCPRLEEVLRLVLIEIDLSQIKHLLIITAIKGICLPEGSDESKCEVLLLAGKDSLVLISVEDSVRSCSMCCGIETTIPAKILCNV